MKIMSNKEYFKIKSEVEAVRNTKEESITNLMCMNQELEIQLEEVLNRLKDMVSNANAKMGKDKYREKIKDLIIFIQGKQR